MEPARRYLRALAACAAATFALVWLYLWCLPITYLDQDYPRWLAKQRLIDGCNLGSVAVVGDSRPLAAIVPALMSMPVANLAMTGTSPIETFYAVSRVLGCPHPPPLIVVAHTAPHFAADPDYWSRGPLLGLLAYRELQEVDRAAAMATDDGGRGTGAGEELPRGLRNWLYSVRFPPFYFASMLGALTDFRWWRNWGVLRQAERSAGQYFFGQADGSSALEEESGLAAFRPSPLIDRYFEKTLEALRERHVKVLYVSVPSNQATYDHLAPGVEQALAAYLHGKERAFDNFRVVGPALACWPDRFFGDFYGHLNRRGAEAFSRDLDGALRQAMAGGDPGPLPDRCLRAAAVDP
jgi:hypothetical protein